MVDDNLSDTKDCDDYQDTTQNSVVTPAEEEFGEMEIIEQYKTTQIKHKKGSKCP